MAAAVALVATLMVPGSARADYSGAPRGSWYTNGSVAAVASSQDGAVAFVGGDFDYVGVRNGPSVRVDAASGELSGAWPKFDGAVDAVVEDGAGGWIVGGSFTTVDGASRARLARIHSSGALDVTWAARANGPVTSLARSGDRLYVGGLFSSVNGSSVGNVARISVGTGQLDTSWTSPSGFSGGGVSAMEVAAGSVYVGGGFSQYDGQPVARLVRLDEATGSVDASFNVGAGASTTTSPIRDIEVVGSRTYVAGSFSTWNGAPRMGFVALDASGAVDPTWNAMANSPDGHDVAVRFDGHVVVAGEFTSAGGAARSGLAAFGPGGGLLAWNPVLAGPAPVSVTTAEFDGSTVYVSGSFSSVSGVPRPRAASLDSQSGAVHGWNPRLSAAATTLAPHGGSVVVGGHVDSVGGFPRPALAAIDVATNEVLPWSPTGGGPVRALLRTGNVLYVAGAVASGAGAVRAVSTVTGVPIAGFVPLAVDAGGHVGAMTEHAGTLYLGGRFAAAAGAPRSNLAAIDARSGLLDPTWTAAADGEVLALADLGTGVIYAGGAFSSVGPTTTLRSRAAAFDLAGNVVAWNPGPDGTVRAMSPSATPAGILLGGDFTTVGGASQLRVALVGTTGASSWTTMSDGAMSTVAAVASAPGSELALVGGSFTTIRGLARPGLAELDRVTGTVTPELAAGTGGSVTALGFASGTLLVGTPGGLVTYQRDATRDTVEPLTSVAQIRETLPGTDAGDGTFSPDPGRIVVRPGAGRSFTLKVRAHDQYDRSFAGVEGAVSGLRELGWGSLPTSVGTWSSGGTAPGRPRGLVTRCWRSATPGSDADSAGVGLSGAIDFGAGHEPDRLPQLPAVLTWDAESPDADGTVDGISCRWTGYVVAPRDEPGDYVFKSYSDDGFRASVDGLGPATWNAISHWSAHTPAWSPQSPAAMFRESDARAFTAEWYDGAGSAVASLAWDTPASVGVTEVPANAYVSGAYYERTYTMSSSVAGSDDLAPLVITGRDHAGLASTATIDVVEDSSPPPAPQSFTSSVPVGPSNATSITITIEDAIGGDLGAAGLLDHRLQREYVTASGGVCGAATNTWQTIDTTVAPATRSFTDVDLAAEGCYRYRYVSRDRVGNMSEHPLGGVATGWIHIDRTNPANGSLSGHEGYLTGATTVITGDMPSDAGSGIDAGATVIERSSAPLSAGQCGGSWGTPEPVSAPGVTLPWTDTTVVDGRCYRYALRVRDRAGNTAVVTSPATTKVDMTAPQPDTTSPSGPVRGTAALTGSVSDTASGPESVTVTYSGPTAGSICMVDPLDASGGWSCPWSTAGLADGAYTVSVVARDRAGNAATGPTSTLVVDNSAPSTSLIGVSSTSGSAVQHFDAGSSTVWVAAGSSGAAAVRVHAEDAGTGVSHVAFAAPAVAGWALASPASDNVPPYEVTYSWSSAAAEPGGMTWNVHDHAGNTASGSYAFRIDGQAPAGGAISYEDGVQSVAAIAITPGADAQSGIASWRVDRRQSVAPTASTCDTSSFTAWAQIAADPPAAYTDTTITSGRCYQYRLVVTDRVGNHSTSTSASTLIAATPGVKIVGTGGTRVVEGGVTDTYTVELRSPPTANVTIAVAGDVQATAAPATLTFTPVNWSTPQTVTVTAVDDERDEPDSVVTSLTHGVSSSDPGYSGMGSLLHAVDTVDDDVSAVLIETVVGELSEGVPGALATYAVRLGSQPSGNVIVKPIGDGQAAADVAALTFTPATWAAPQQVALRALDDPDLEGRHSSTVAHAVESGSDARYHELVAAPASASIADDEQARILVNVSASADVDEAAAGDAETISVRLAARPVGVVTVAASAVAGQVALSAQTLTFSPATWDMPQSVSVTAIDDTMAEPDPHAARVTFAPSSIDPRWGAAGDTVVALGVKDDDTAALSARVAPGAERSSDGAVALEEGAAAGVVVGIRADGDPSSDVVIVPSSTPRGQLVFSPASVTIPAGSHGQVVSFTVRAANDDVQETAVHDATLGFTVRTGDALYAAASLADIRFGIADDDAPRTTRDATPDPAPPTTTGGGSSGGGATPQDPAPTTDGSRSDGGDAPTADPAAPTDGGGADAGTQQTGASGQGGTGASGSSSDETREAKGSASAGSSKRATERTGLRGAADRTKRWAKENTGAAITGASAAVAASSAVAAKVAGGAAVKGIGTSMLGEPTSMVRRVVQGMSPTGGENGPNRPGSRTIKKVWQRARNARGGIEPAGSRGPKIRRNVRDLLPPEPDPGFDLDIDRTLAPNADAGFELDLDADPTRDAGFNLDLDDYAA